MICTFPVTFIAVSMYFGSLRMTSTHSSIVFPIVTQFIFEWRTLNRTLNLLTKCILHIHVPHRRPIQTRPKPLQIRLPSLNTLSPSRPRELMDAYTGYSIGPSASSSGASNELDDAHGFEGEGLDQTTHSEDAVQC